MPFDCSSSCSLFFYYFCENGEGHMTKMATTTYIVKTFKNLLLENSKSYDLETWHAALVSQALHIHVNGDPGLILTYFTAKSNMVDCAFEWGKLFQSNEMG